MHFTLGEIASPSLTQIHDEKFHRGISHAGPAIFTLELNFSVFEFHGENFTSSSLSDEQGNLTIVSRLKNISSGPFKS